MQLEVSFFLSLITFIQERVLKQMDFFFSSIFRIICWQGEFQKFILECYTSLIYLE